MHAMIDPRTERARAVILQPLVAWIIDRLPHPAPIRILDYGCGDLLLGRLLPERFIVDGFDRSPAAYKRASTANRPRHLVNGSTVYRSAGEIPLAQYQLVVINSVIQYQSDVGAVGELLLRARSHLLRGAEHVVGIVATDVVIEPNRRLHEGWDLASTLARGAGVRLGLGTMIRYGARKPVKLLTLKESAFRVVALDAGLTVERNAANLTPLTPRATFILRPSVVSPSVELDRR